MENLHSSLFEEGLFDENDLTRYLVKQQVGHDRVMTI